MPTITITIDDTHEGYALYGELICRYGVDATDFDLNGGYTLEDYNADLDAISGVSDLTRGALPEADPTPPHGTERPYLSDFDIIHVDCPHPGCPGRPHLWCGSPRTGYSYGPHFIHAARKAAARGNQ